MTRVFIPWGRESFGSCRPKLYSHNAGSFRIFFRSPVTGAAGAAVEPCGLWAEAVVLDDEQDDETSVSTGAARVDCAIDVLHGLVVGGANAAPLVANRKSNATENFAILELLKYEICVSSQRDLDRANYD